MQIDDATRERVERLGIKPNPGDAELGTLLRWLAEHGLWPDLDHMPTAPEPQRYSCRVSAATTQYGPTPLHAAIAAAEAAAQTGDWR